LFRGEVIREMEQGADLFRVFVLDHTTNLGAAEVQQIFVVEVVSGSHDVKEGFMLGFVSLVNEVCVEEVLVPLIEVFIDVLLERLRESGGLGVLVVLAVLDDQGESLGFAINVELEFGVFTFVFEHASEHLAGLGSLASHLEAVTILGLEDDVSLEVNTLVISGDGVVSRHLF
jgi:hypothetical protein